MQIPARLPYTHEVLSVFLSEYHQSIWPIQIIAVILTAITIYILIKPFAQSSRLIITTLVIFWFWIGTIYYIQELTSLSFMAPLYGIVWVIQAGLFVCYIIIPFSKKIYFENNIHGYSGIILIIFAVIIYPLAMTTFDNRWASYRMVGVTPVATAIYTLGVILQIKYSKVIKSILSVIPIMLIIVYGISGWLLLQNDVVA